MNLRLRVRILSIVLPMLMLSLPFGASAQDIAAGEKLFKANCASCHRTVGNLVGPQLSGVAAKYASDKEWMYSWVKNSKALIDAGDPKALALYEQYNKQIMSLFPTLTNEEIDNILAYADDAAAPKEPTGGPVVTTQDPLADPTIYYGLLALVGVLLLIALLLVIITATLITAVRAKEQQEPFRIADVVAQVQLILKNRWVVTSLAVLLTVGGLGKWIAEARTISLHQGYMPEQPIKFSHKLHAGTHNINCEYCHSGVTKSKSAWIPSVNVCMNCHKYIQQGPNYGTEEIGKILAAYEENKPVEWVRIHNLPDHAYFNHAQHVVVGGLECQTCHGPIQEMEVVYQYSDLGMGWCVSCHRETKVKHLGQETDMTVEDMGGLNCARCHY